MDDGGTRVPLIAHWPGKTAKGAVRQDLVDMSDFLPTMCEAAGVTIPASRVQDGRSFLPQLKGERGNPRDWIYVWYSRPGGPTGENFTRNQRYKLYSTGKMYDIVADVLEKKPLSASSDDKDLAATRAMLQSALDKYADARPAEVIAKGNKKALQKQKATAQ